MGRRSHFTPRRTGSGSAARRGDTFDHAARAAGVVMMSSNSTGVKRPRASCRRRPEANRRRPRRGTVGDLAWQHL